jgi:acyl carrier protein
MPREEIMTQVNDLLANEFEVEVSNITPEANVKETLMLDSLSLVDMVALLQFNYKITIPVNELQKIQTFNDLYDYIVQHQAQ